ncbi:c-type cytochrome [Elizabethkingia meningoseptica]|uniref:c-type cytochrome n=1 Tax=Elizabethkingia meningoseptica TaxID=238 RepID=UPI002011E607|nr:cytochrome c [Elizabethkingia meningoseptica]MCL1677072.1 cytochrome c [Elizabethkingia meningoseptica]MCL1688027.1 cytochrome c [Elizabethkingia meningoseptica]
MRKIIVVAGVTFFIISCGTRSKTVASTDKPSFKLTEQQLATATELFNTRCGKCHDLPKPEDHTAEQWKPIMDQMAPKAKLTDEEKNWVLAYVSANAKKQN